MTTSTERQWAALEKAAEDKSRAKARLQRQRERDELPRRTDETKTATERQVDRLIKDPES